ncbi:hypothetical protein [Synechococcus sp. CCY9202]|uniref:hypothetical protein n=1 Tax=Synechococcus sp. CCY9202 TaxID=174698 RepID=UPI002B219EA0|nr:hypothetical protein [Synechococcus sp. CCY9202]
MGTFNRPSRRRRRSATRPRYAPPAGRPGLSWGVVATIALVLVFLPVLLYNQHQSGHQPLKMRRELRKF